MGESYFDNVYNKLPGLIRNNIKISIKTCGIKAVVDQIYSTIGSASQLVNLLEEISKGIAVIHKVIIQATLNNWVEYCTVSYVNNLCTYNIIMLIAK